MSNKYLEKIAKEKKEGMSTGAKVAAGVAGTAGLIGAGIAAKRAAGARALRKEVDKVLRSAKTNSREGTAYRKQMDSMRKDISKSNKEFDDEISKLKKELED